MELKNYLIAIDLDGTLITGFDSYDKKSFRLLKQLAKENFIVIATGRPLRSSKYYYDLLELNTPIINYNGALLQHPLNQNFPAHSIYIKREDLLIFMKDNFDIIENIFCEIGDDIFLHKQTDQILPYLHSDGGNLTTGTLDKTLQGDPNGAIIFSKTGTEERLIKYVKTQFQGRMMIRIWHVKDIVISEFYNPLTTKANALERVRQFYNIPKAKTIAFGDGHNDLEMIRYARFGVAMENSHHELLRVAPFKTKSVNDHGVYYFLKNFIKFKQFFNDFKE